MTKSEVNTESNMTVEEVSLLSVSANQQKLVPVEIITFI